MDQGALATLVAKQEIYEALLRYCRGLDRNDAELVRSAYHPDATHDHGLRFKGGALEYTELMTAPRPESNYSVHYLTNALIELDGDEAHCESRWLFFGGERGADNVRTAYGRYLDRFEDRGDGWKIAARVVVMDNTAMLALGEPATEAMFAQFAPSTTDATDISYQRPLVAPYVAAASET